MCTATEPRLAPYVTLRDREKKAAGTLAMDLAAPGRPRLYYRDEHPADRDNRGVLWVRYSQRQRDPHGMPTGRPRPHLLHPLRQRETMFGLKCAVCLAPARTPLGWIFLKGPDELWSQDDLVLTAHPPVCPEHVQEAAHAFPHLKGRPLVYLSASAPSYGVHGMVCEVGRSPEHELRFEDTTRLLPYGHARLPTFLASQMVRQLADFEVITVRDLMSILRSAAVIAA
ncbi:hypothetical protein ACFY8B_35730 [Streptomyces sp. NPDC012751]|uniref:hypothetical protein n=1 Tax=Streptomyces sp. NPDC012751 TaxID=3364846 RepID=UPI00368DEE66